MVSTASLCNSASHLEKADVGALKDNRLTPSRSTVQRLIKFFHKLFLEAGFHLPGQDANDGLVSQVLLSSRAIFILPFRVVVRLLLRTVQVILALIVLILHPQIKLLRNAILRSSVFIKYITPIIQKRVAPIYEPYFSYLKTLSPYWATLSIAVPLAILEPAKLFATIMIAERPKIGILLWLLLQGLSFVLIDKTWSAVRPQSRKIWIVSRLHAWGSLTVAYGKYWIRSSMVYLTATRWAAEARAAIQAFISGRDASGRGDIIGRLFYRQFRAPRRSASISQGRSSANRRSSPYGSRSDSGDGGRHRIIRRSRAIIFSAGCRLKRESSRVFRG